MTIKELIHWLQDLEEEYKVRQKEREAMKDDYGVGYYEGKKDMIFGIIKRLKEIEQ